MYILYNIVTKKEQGSYTTKDSAIKSDEYDNEDCFIFSETELLLYRKIETLENRLDKMELL